MNGVRIRVSDNGRFFADGSGRPLFWLGDTQWNLFRCHTYDEAKLILQDRKRKGFTVIQVMLLGFSEEVEGWPVVGEAFPEKNPASPNLAYFAHVDAIVRLAEEIGLILAIGLDHPKIRLLDSETARTCGRWVGERYKAYSHIIWVPTYYVPQGEDLTVTREAAIGLSEGSGGANLITLHPDAIETSGIVHDEPWLDFNCIQTFTAIDRVYEAVAADYARGPVKPVVMAEGAYEEGPEYGVDVTPFLVRRQAYLSYFAGGHHSYGHNVNWRVSPAWQSALDSPGARQMAVLRAFFESYRWWELIPDRSLLPESRTDGGPAVRAALRSPSGKLMIVYASGSGVFTVRFGAADRSSPIRYMWIHPVDGGKGESGTLPAAAGASEFAVPPGWEDALLVLEV